MSNPIFPLLFSVVNTNHAFQHNITASYISLYQPHLLPALDFICKGHDVSAAQASVRALQDRLTNREKRPIVPLSVWGDRLDGLVLWKKERMEEIAERGIMEQTDSSKSV